MDAKLGEFHFSKLQHSIIRFGKIIIDNYGYQLKFNTLPSSHKFSLTDESVASGQYKIKRSTLSTYRFLFGLGRCR